MSVNVSNVRNSYAMFGNAILGSIFWGISGTVSSVLFSVYRMPFLSLLTLRMLIAGPILFIFSAGFIKKTDIPFFIIFSIIGLLGVQLFYLGTISYSNAPTATLLQFLFFPIVAVFDFLHSHRGSLFYVLMAVLLALIGTFELSTGYPYSSDALKISGIAVIFGLITAATASIYTLTSPRLVMKYGGIRTVSLGLIVGGVFSAPLGFAPSLLFFETLRKAAILPVILMVIFVGIVGTLIAFLL
ncbi:MAG: EamA family transporter, partial [Thermoplasmata archaeon]